jgi:quinoprotein glucose dehydrogenase
MVWYADCMPAQANYCGHGNRWSGGTGHWLSGAANAWSIMSADPQAHLIYVPTGSASTDYYGGLRPGDNRWANSVVALDSRAGKLVWGYQLVHHDLWDYDTATAPLVTSVGQGTRNAGGDRGQQDRNILCP